MEEIGLWRKYQPGLLEGLKMMHKTKAALQSCQCHYQIPKQNQHTRVNAGGQSLQFQV
jgi:hypothetical protein